jgi:hypothetical protein
LRRALQAVAAGVEGQQLAGTRRQLPIVKTTGLVGIVADKAIEEL